MAGDVRRMNETLPQIRLSLRIDKELLVPNVDILRKFHSSKFQYIHYGGDQVTQWLLVPRRGFT